MKKFLKVTCLVLLSMSLFMSCEKKDILTEDVQGRIVPEGVAGFIGPNTNGGVYKNSEKDYVPGRLDEPVASGNGWVLVKVAHNEVETGGEDYIRDEAEWVLKGAAKRTVANYWVKEKLLGDNLAKYLTKTPGPVGFLYHFLSVIPTANKADKFPQTYVKESDGNTYISDHGLNKPIYSDFGWFETTTSFERGDWNLDYYIGLYFWDNSKGTYSTLATAYLPWNTTNSMGDAGIIVWDFDLKIYDKYDAYQVWIWRWNNNNWEKVAVNSITHW